MTKQFEEDKMDKWQRPVDPIDEDKAKDGVEKEDNQAEMGEVADESLTRTGQAADVAVQSFGRTIAVWLWQVYHISKPQKLAFCRAKFGDGIGTADEEWDDAAANNAESPMLEVSFVEAARDWDY